MERIIYHNNTRYYHINIFKELNARRRDTIAEQAEQLKKCQEIAMALGVEHNEKNTVIAKQQLIIDKLKAVITKNYDLLRDIGNQVIDEGLLDVTIEFALGETVREVEQLEAKYKGKE